MELGLVALVRSEKDNEIAMIKRRSFLEDMALSIVVAGRPLRHGKI